MRVIVHTFLVFVLIIAVPIFSYSEMKAGLASVVITPKENLWMSGYAARTQPAEGKLHDLYAKAIAIEDEQGTRIVMVTTDLIGVSAQLTNAVIERVTKQTNLPRKAIMLTASHTHSGPVVRQNLETMYELDESMWNKITQYNQQLEDLLVQVILESIQNLEPSILQHGKGRAAFAVNRRIYTKEGMQFGENPIGPVDHDVPVLQISDKNHDQKGLLFGYACHNTTLDGYEYCGDYAGFAQAYLDQLYPEGIHLFFSGCGGDINPHPRRTIAHAKQHGDELGTAVTSSLKNTLHSIDGEIKLAFEEVDIPLTQPPNREQLKQQLESSHKYVKLLA